MFTTFKKFKSQFSKGARRDASKFPRFEDDTKFQPWDRECKALAVTQCIDLPFNEKYVPVTPTEQARFDDQNKFLYSVYVLKLKTSMSKGVLGEQAGRMMDKLCAMDSSSYISEGILGKISIGQPGRRH